MNSRKTQEKIWKNELMCEKFTHLDPKYYLPMKHVDSIFIFDCFTEQSGLYPVVHYIRGKYGMLGLTG